MEEAAFGESGRFANVFDQILFHHAGLASLNELACFQTSDANAAFDESPIDGHALQTVSNGRTP
jgi:hypothetical protein